MALCGTCTHTQAHIYIHTGNVYYYCVVLASCLMSLTYWKIHILGRRCFADTKGFPAGFTCILLDLLYRLPHKPSRTYCREVFPQRDAATIMLHSGDSEFLMMCSVAYAKHAVQSDGQKAQLWSHQTINSSFSWLQSFPHALRQTVAKMSYNILTVHFFSLKNVPGEAQGQNLLHSQTR